MGNLASALDELAVDTLDELDGLAQFDAIAELVAVRHRLDGELARRLSIGPTSWAGGVAGRLADPHLPRRPGRGACGPRSGAARR